MSIRSEGKSSVETTESHFFHDVIVTRSIEAEVYVDGKLVNQPKETTRRRIVRRWDRIALVALLVGFVIFICIRTSGF